MPRLRLPTARGSAGYWIRCRTYSHTTTLGAARSIVEHRKSPQKNTNYVTKKRLSFTVMVGIFR